MDRNFLRLGELTIGTGDLQLELRFGVVTLAYAAANTSNTVTVTHGLGRVPAAVVATSLGAPAFGNITNANIVGSTSTTFNINGETQAAFTGNVTLYWIAIG